MQHVLHNEYHAKAPLRLSFAIKQHYYVVRIRLLFFLLSYSLPITWLLIPSIRVDAHESTVIKNYTLRLIYLKTKNKEKRREEACLVSRSCSLGNTVLCGSSREIVRRWLHLRCVCILINSPALAGPRRYNVPKPNKLCTQNKDVISINQ